MHVSEWRPANHGKKYIAASMYAKGTAFIGAAALLHRNGGYQYVVLHLLCQGIEVAMKGLLLAKDYDKYNPMLKGIGHNLSKAVDTAIAAGGFSPLKPAVRTELENLSQFYKKHLLRYGSIMDILVDPHSISSERVVRKMLAVVRLVRRRNLVPPLLRLGA